MSNVSVSSAIQRMRKEYGDGNETKCDLCCNCQITAASNQNRVCIAYSDTQAWNPEALGCGLFNVAFRGLRPKRRPLSEMYENKKHSSKKEDQGSLFDL